MFSPSLCNCVLSGYSYKFPINAPIEVVGGKLSAISSRVVPRDLYDLFQIAKNQSSWSTGDKSLDHAVFMYYFSLSLSFPKDVDTFNRFLNREKEFKDILWPVLPNEMKLGFKDLATENTRSFYEWATTPQNQNESRYLQKFCHGEYEPELLFSDYPEILQNAINSPSIKWRLRNISIAIDKGIINPSEAAKRFAFCETSNFEQLLDNGLTRFNDPHKNKDNINGRTFRQER